MLVTRVFTPAAVPVAGAIAAAVLAAFCRTPVAPLRPFWPSTAPAAELPLVCASRPVTVPQVRRYPSPALSAPAPNAESKGAAGTPGP